MRDSTANQTVITEISLYNILEAFLAGTSDSFLVLDGNKNIVIFNNNFNEFIGVATGKYLVKTLPFHAFINETPSLSLIASATDKAYEDGQTNKFSFSVDCKTKRWYDVEFHPLKKDDLVVGVGIGLFETTQKREAEEAVKRSEALFKALVQNSTDIFILTDSFFRVTYISDAFKKLLGYHPESIIGKVGFSLIHQDDVEMVAAWLAKIIEKPGHINTVEIRLKNHIGNWIYFQAAAQNLLHHKQVGSLIFNLTDIHSNKIADHALINAEQRLTLLLNNTKESFIILNKKFEVTSYNKAAQENAPFFFTRELQSGLSILDLIPSSQVEHCLSLLNEAMHGKEVENETRFTDEDKKLHIYHHTFRLLNGGSEAGIFITSTDITEKKTAELSLRENEEKFKTIIEYSFDAVVVIDSDVNIIYASPSITNLLGYEVEELLGKNSLPFIHPDDVEGVRSKVTSIVANHEEQYADYRFMGKDGSYKWIEAKGKNMFDNRHIQGILVSLRDISERKILMEEQKMLSKELLKYNNDLKQFSFITSHNLRAPVANLISLLSLYNHEKPGDQFNATVLEKFEECTVKLNETLDDLVNVLVVRSNPNADKEFVRFTEIASKVEKNIAALLASANGEIRFDFSKAEGIVYNKVHLESIFINLISNSIKYASSDRDLSISVISENTETGTTISFKDNGIGINLERYGDRIFGLYQRFHAAKEGKGLGLYMIKSQIVASGGDIQVFSKQGEGTTFIVHFRPANMNTL
jgi:PAS domain S-box-containing protein